MVASREELVKICECKCVVEIDQNKLVKYSFIVSTVHRRCMDHKDLLRLDILMQYFPIICGFSDISHFFNYHKVRIKSKHDLWRINIVYLFKLKRHRPYYCLAPHSFRCSTDYPFCTIRWKELMDLAGPRERSWRLSCRCCR